MDGNGRDRDRTAGGSATGRTDARAWAGVTIDCRDPRRVAEFWSALLNVPARPAGPDRAGWLRLGPAVRDGPVLNFQPVPEEKVGKARTHLDVWVDDLQGSIELVERLGGARAAEVQALERGRIAVMADPEGNEFCLIAGPTNRRG
jgi:predicted enzyme related to lactoylglutathione lyase